MELISVLAVAGLGMSSPAWAQVHGAPTTASPPGQSTIAPPGPAGLPATTSPGANSSAAINPATSITPGQPSLNATNNVTVAPGAANASGVPLNTNPDGTLSPTTAPAGASSTTTTTPQSTTPVNAVNMPTARSPYTPAAPGQAAPTSAQSQSQSTGR